MALSQELTDAERRAQNQRTTSEILCDYPGCQKVAVEIMGGGVRELNTKFAVCAEHLNLPEHTTKSSS